MTKYIFLGIVLMAISVVAGAQMHTTSFAQTAAPTMMTTATPTPAMTVPKAAPATGRTM